MSGAKITLSPKELELVNNAEWILTKNLIIQKVYALFGQLADEYRSLHTLFPDMEKSPVFLYSPKISRGEQYQELPYVMLDYPRCFEEQGYFAIRSFFWWGNHCSIHLVLSGKFLETYGPSVDRFLQLHGPGTQERKDWYIGVGETPWQHHFEQDNYQPLNQWSLPTVTSLPFLKLAKKIPLEEWDDLTLFYTRHFSRLLAILTEY